MCNQTEQFENLLQQVRNVGFKNINNQEDRDFLAQHHNHWNSCEECKNAMEEHDKLLRATSDQSK